MPETIEYEQFERDAEPAHDGSAPPGGPSADGAAADALRAGADLARLGEVPMQLSVELGRTQLTVSQTLDLRPGSVIELERAAGAPADLLVNGTPIARGEVVVVDERYGLRIGEILASEAPPGAGESADPPREGEEPGSS